MDFERTTKQGMRALPLTPLIDVTFILIIFFMLTTSFMRVESMELILPGKGGKSAERQEVLRLILKESGDVQLGSRKLEPDELEGELKKIFARDASAKMLVLTGKGVTMQQLVAAMDRINQAGGQSIYVRKAPEGK